MMKLLNCIYYIKRYGYLTFITLSSILLAYTIGCCVPERFLIFTLPILLWLGKTLYWEWLY